MPSPYADTGPERTEKTAHYQRLNAWIDSCTNHPDAVELRKIRQQYQDNRRKHAWQPKDEPASQSVNEPTSKPGVCVRGTTTALKED